MRCPKCGRDMVRGAPHADGSIWQWECNACGAVISVGPDQEEDHDRQR